MPQITIPRTALAIAILAFIVHWSKVAILTLPDTWHWDFKYFWQAGEMWAAGLSPYSPDYLDRGAARFDRFTNPFFYPPNALPFMALLALFPPAVGAGLFFFVNISLLIFISMRLSRLAENRGASLAPLLVFAVILMFVGVYMRPSFRAAQFGQFAILLGAAFTLVICAKGKYADLQRGAGLTLLMIKPHFGVAILVFALMRRDMRKAALAAALSTAALCLIGLAPIGLWEGARGFLDNLSLYTQLEDNDVRTMGGLTFLAAQAGVAIPAFVKLVLLCLPAAALARYTPRHGNAAAALCLTMVWAFLVAPYHSTDFVLLAPALAIALGRTSMMARVTLLIALMLLGRSWTIVRELSIDGLDSASLAGIVHMMGISLLAVAIFVHLTARLTHGAQALAARKEQTSAP